MYAPRFERHVGDPSSVERTLVLVPSLGTASRVWDGVVDALRETSPTTEVLRMDLPGHGTGDREEEPFSIEDLATRTSVAIEAARSTSLVTVAGLSMGGAVALEIARGQPDWLASFAMFASAPRFGHRAGWVELMARVRSHGTQSLRTDSAAGWFTPEFRRSHPATVAAMLDDLATVDDASYLWCCNALAEYDAGPSLATVAVPALVVAAWADRAVTHGAMRRLADGLPHARYAGLNGAHLAIVEQPERAALLLRDLVRRPAANPRPHMRPAGAGHG